MYTTAHWLNTIAAARGSARMAGIGIFVAWRGTASPRAINSFYRAHRFFLVASRRAIFYRVVFPPRVRDLSPR